MARVALSEYAAKTLLNQNNYAGVTATADTDFSKLKLPKDSLVVKVDDGTKKRNKLGLVKVGVTDNEAIAAAKEWLDSGYARILIEPMVAHEASEEKYISLTLEREGVKVLYSDTEPHRAMVNTWPEKWLFPTLALGGSGFWLILSAIPSLICLVMAWFV